MGLGHGPCLLLGFSFHFGHSPSLNEIVLVFDRLIDIDEMQYILVAMKYDFQ